MLYHVLLNDISVVKVNSTYCGDNDCTTTLMKSNFPDNFTKYQLKVVSSLRDSGVTTMTSVFSTAIGEFFLLLLINIVYICHDVLPPQKARARNILLQKYTLISVRNT